MKLKKKTKVLLFLLSIIAITVISAILAYLTDKEVRQNEFTIGSIDIKLEETLWDALPDVDNNGVPDAAEAMGPGDTIAKDPKVVNEGQNDAYVYLRIEVPKTEIKVEGGALERQELFTYTINDTNWKLMSDLTIDDEAGNKVIYTYYYQNTLGTEDYLKAGATSETIFNSVTLKNVTNFNSIAMEQQIVVKAYAIQMGEELTVNTNPWVTQFKNESAGIAVQEPMAKVAKEGNDYMVSMPFSSPVYGDSTGGDITDSNLKVTGQVGTGEPKEMSLVDSSAASLTDGKKLALSSRATQTGGVKVLKYKYTGTAEETGEFKLVSVTGKLYTQSGKQIPISTPKVKIEETLEPVYDYEIGTRVSVVTQNNGTEYFYVLENSDSSESKVKLIAEYCLNSSLKQSTSAQTVAFSTEKYWSDITADGTFKDNNGTERTHYNLNEYTIGNATRMAKATAITRAQNYATTKVGHDAIGRLMTGKECEILLAKSTTLVYGNSTKLKYWLGAAYGPSSNCVWRVNGTLGRLIYDTYDNSSDYAVRPVIEISKSYVSN